jgi:hypothetical protein
VGGTVGVVGVQEGLQVLSDCDMPAASGLASVGVQCSRGCNVCAAWLRWAAPKQLRGMAYASASAVLMIAVIHELMVCC